MTTWLLTIAGLLCVLAAQIWQGPFDRQLIICALVAFTVAGTRYLRELVQGK
jgi:hypothetical protein